MAGVSERWLCEQVGLSPTHTSSARAKGGDVGWDRIARMAELLAERGISALWLLFGEGAPIIPERVGPRRSSTPAPVRPRRS